MTVYFLRAGETHAVKIGCCKGNLHERVKVLQMGNPEPLHVIKTIDAHGPAERQLQKHYRNRHIRGEWFRFCPSMMVIEQILNIDMAEGFHGSPPSWMRSPVWGDHRKRKQASA
jgi:hypothetical protein